MTDDPTLVDAERRRGRGARSNRVGRYESEPREAFDDGWESLARAGGLQDRRARGDGQKHHRPQRQPRHQLRPVDQPLPWLRARLHLLLRPPHACLPRPFRRASISRPSCTPRSTPPSCWRRELGQSPLCAEVHRARRRHRPLSADRARAPHHPLDPRGARPRQPPGRHRHQVGPGGARHRHPGPHGRRADLAKVAISVTTLDRSVARKMEPRAPTPPKRLEAISHWPRPACRWPSWSPPSSRPSTTARSKRSWPPPRDAGASEAGYVLLRLPLELKDLFREWLRTEFPDRADRVINILRSMHGGKDYTPEWRVRQRGKGPYAEQIGLRFRLATKRLGSERTQLRAAHSTCSSDPCPRAADALSFDSRSPCSQSFAQTGEAIRDEGDLRAGSDRA